MSKVSFETKLYKIKSWTILSLPKDASLQLPSRGQVMVKGTINGFPFQSPLEPDGRLSHWFRVSDAMMKAMGIKAGDKVNLEIEPSKDWPEPTLPQDLQVALKQHPDVKTLWNNITTAARWDWLRWIGGTKEETTRKRRIEVALSKLKSGTKRPCCFNRNMCTEPYVSKSGGLLEPEV